MTIQGIFRLKVFVRIIVKLVYIVLKILVYYNGTRTVKKKVIVRYLSL